MQRSGRSSWRLVTDIDAEASTALYVGQLLKLPVATSPIPWPLRLLGADILPKPAPAQVEDAIAMAWRRWWESIVASWSPAGSSATAPSARISEPVHAFEQNQATPPAAREIGRSILIAAKQEADAWFEAQVQALPRPRHKLLDIAVIRDAASAVLDYTGVSPDRIRATIAFLLTAEPTWWVVAPGVVAASVSVVDDTELVRRLLSEIFYSSVNRPS